VQLHDDRDVFQSSPDGLPAIDIHSLCPLPPARSRQSRPAAGLGGIPQTSRKTATSEGEGRRTGKAWCGSGEDSTQLTSRSSARHSLRKCHWPGCPSVFSREFKRRSPLTPVVRGHRSGVLSPAGANPEQGRFPCFQANFRQVLNFFTTPLHGGTAFAVLVVAGLEPAMSPTYSSDSRRPDPSF